MNPAQVYVEHLDVINRIAASLCRRNGVRGADAEDFAADVRLKLLQDDYAVLRKYRGASNLTTFLTVVISNLFRDYRIRLWGRWRPSAEARRRGEVAVMLEAAIYRDGQSFDQACNTLAQDGRLTVDRAELRKLLADLPHRGQRRPNVDDGADVEDMPATDSADGSVLEHEREQRVEAAKAALHRSVDRLPPEDRMIVKLHFFEAMRVADVARAVGVQQKPLYTRLKRLLASLSEDLSRQGIGPEYREWLDSEPP
jgi:RNA polymerase sigma factor for flagellar operon FliA